MLLQTVAYAAVAPRIATTGAFDRLTAVDFWLEEQAEADCGAIPAGELSAAFLFLRPPASALNTAILSAISLVQAMGQHSQTMRRLHSITGEKDFESWLSQGYISKQHRKPLRTLSLRAIGFGPCQLSEQQAAG